MNNSKLSTKYLQYLFTPSQTWEKKYRSTSRFLPYVVRDEQGRQ